MVCFVEKEIRWMIWVLDVVESLVSSLFSTVCQALPATLSCI